MRQGGPKVNHESRVSMASETTTPLPTASGAAAPKTAEVRPQATPSGVTPQAAAAQAVVARPAIDSPVPAPRPATPLVAVPQPAAPPPPAPPPAAGPAAAPLLPPAGTARARFRHWILLSSFVILVLIPVGVVAGYLWTRATDQYLSNVAFSIRKTDAQPGLELLGGLSAFTSTGGAKDNDVLQEYFLSPDMVVRISEKIDLRAVFSREWPNDFWFAFDPDGKTEDLVEFWRRQVKVLNDDKTGIMSVQVAAFTPEDAQQIASAVFDEGARFVNELSAISRDDTTRFARAELAKAEDRVREVRAAFTEFRTRTQVVDPTAEFTGAMTIVGELEAQLTEAMIAHDVLLESNTRENDPRLEQARRRISAIEGRIEKERAKFSADTGPGGESYANLVAEYEILTTDREFAEAAYTAARASLDISLAEAERRSRYLAAHISPQKAELSERPDRPLVLAFFTLFVLLGWGILTLIYYSVRDRS